MPEDWTRGFENLRRKLDQFAKNARALDGAHQVPFSGLFTPDFMRKHTRAASFEELLEAGGFLVASPEDFAAIPDDQWEQVVRTYTEFASWLEMQKEAGAEWAAAQLRKGV